MDIDYQKLAQELLHQTAGATYKAVVGASPTAVMGHGSGGLFSHHALEKPVFSAMTLPNIGLQALMPVKPSRTTNPLYGIFTGVTATTGSEPTNPCDDPPYAGLAKLCMHQFVFGRYSRMTRVFELDQFGKLQDRGDHLDLQLMNPPNPLGANAPTIAGIDKVLQSDIAKGLFEFGVAWARDFARTFYTGNPTNNTAGNGYMEFYGLEFLINTGYRDAITGVVCPAADSLIRSFGDVNIANAPATIVTDITEIYLELENIATQTGLDPATWVLAMRPQLFHVLTSIWPCSYYSSGCNLVAPMAGQVDLGDMTALRDAMRAGSYLLIGGKQVPVVQDPAIPETEVGAGVYESQIYFVPLTVLGGTPVTYMEYFDYSTPEGFQAAANAFAPPGSYDISDNGRFAWHRKPPTNWCVQMLAKTEPRLLLLTPYIAARLTDIRYTPYVHERDWSPSGTYFVDGGNSSGQSVPSYYSPHA